VPAIIGFTAARCASIAEESIRLRISAQAKVLELLDAGALNALRDVPGQIEHGMAGAVRWSEKARIGSIGSKETFNEFGSDLVILLPDCGTKCGRDVAAVGT
jgi:hypothetical protein